MTLAASPGVGRRTAIATGVLLAITLAATVTAGAPSWLVAPPTGGKFTQKSGITARGRAFRLVVRTGPLDRLRREYRTARAPRPWGDASLDLGVSYTIDTDFLLGISLTIDGDRVSVPPEAFMDLFALRALGVEEAGDELHLRFEGADAGESYYGFLAIRERKVVRREVWNGEFPDGEHEVKRFGS